MAFGQHPPQIGQVTRSNRLYQVIVGEPINLKDDEPTPLI
jgi:hypothetical protein